MSEGKCTASHPVNDRPCEDFDGHIWCHAYNDERVTEANRAREPRDFIGERVWWSLDGDDMRDLAKLEADLEAAQQVSLFPVSR